MITLAAGQTSIPIEQDKDALKSYSFELVDIIPPGDTLVSVTWAPAAGITLSNPGNDSTTAVVRFSGGVQRTWYACVATWLTASGETDQFVVRIYIKEDEEAVSVLGSALFPNKFSAVSEMRRDRLLLAAKSHFTGVELSSEYIWRKLIAAEAEASRTLRVRFKPTMFFPVTPTQDQIDALNGMPWDEDPAYDYDPDMFKGDMWGFMATRNRPVQSVLSFRYAYPSNGGFSYDVPLDWLKVDKKYGQIRIVPTSQGSLAVLNSFIMQTLGAGRMIPQMMQLTYVAGLANAVQDFPDLVDLVKKMAVLKIIEDSYIPQSGSISADGLSQSMSIDMGKYDDMIDRIINGPKGSNGGLMTAIHGMRLGVM